MRRPRLTPWALALACAGCEARPFGEIIVEVDADADVLAALRSLEISVWDGETRVDTTEVTPTNERPGCLPLSVGVTPEGDFAPLPVGIQIDATFRTGGGARRRADTVFAPGTHLLEVLLDRRCLEAGCDDPLPAPQPIDRSALEQRIARTECKTVPTATECLNMGGCFDDADLVAPVCRIPCPAQPPAPQPPDPPLPPQPAAPPAFACPAGWNPRAAIREGAPETCEPWAMRAGPDCPPGQAAFPGAPACAPLSPCPAGEWPEGLLPGALHVHPRAPAGGDGSLATPFATIAGALAAAADGAVIALAKGTYTTAPLVLQRAVELAGACAEETVIAGTTRDREPLFTIGARGAALRALRIEPALGAISVSAGAVQLTAVELAGTAEDALVAGGGASVHLERVSARQLGGAGLVIEGAATATVTAASITAAAGAVRVAGGSVVITGARLGAGIDASAGGRVVLRDSVVEETATASVRARGARTVVHLERTISRDTGAGDAIHVEDAAVLEAAGLVIERAPAGGLRVDGASASVTDLVVFDVTAGPGVACEAAATCTVERAWLERTRGEGIHVADGAGATVLDLTVLDVRTDSSYGLVVETSTAHVTRVRIGETRDAAVDVSGAGASLTLEDASLADNARLGVLARAGVRLDVFRARLEGHGSRGIELSSSSTSHSRVLLEDVEVLNTRTLSTTVDDGVGLQAGAASVAHVPIEVTVRRARFSGNSSAGINVGRANMKLEDVEANETEIGQGFSAVGFGLSAVTGAVVRGIRVAFRDNEDAGVHSAGPTSEIHLEDVLVRDTSCPVEEPFCGVFHGAGVAIQLNGYVELDRFHLDANRQNGLQINFEGAADLRNGVISNHPTGAYARAGGFAVQRIGVNVIYRDNGENVRFGDEPQ